MNDVRTTRIFITTTARESLKNRKRPSGQDRDACENFKRKINNGVRVFTHTHTLVTHFNKYMYSLFILNYM